MEAIIHDLALIEDAYTEAYDLFTGHDTDGIDLGMLAPGESSIDLTIDKHQYSIKQSPGLLKSDHAGGTTGAALWRSGIHAAEWLASKDSLFNESLLGHFRAVVELGAGTAGLCSCVLARRIAGNGRVIATDMPQSLKLLRENIASNLPHQQAGKARKASARTTGIEVEVHTLDWEQDDAQSLLRSIDLVDGIDLIVACDCVYNNALIEPLVQTCAAICSLRQDAEPTICLIVQQLRHPDILEEWLECALSLFDIWRVPDRVLSTALSQKNGFVVHLLRLKRTQT